jgi:hypothetical protein
MNNLKRKWINLCWKWIKMNRELNILDYKMIFSYLKNKKCKNYLI